MKKRIVVLGSLALLLAVVLVWLTGRGTIPEEADKTALVGIDADGDGVRDDVQQYIATTYSESAKKRAALTQMTVALQARLTGTNNGNQQIDDAIDCVTSVFMIGAADVAGGIAARDAHESLRAVVLNTPERTTAFFEASSGASVTFSTPYAQTASRCSTDLSQLPN